MQELLKLIAKPAHAAVQNLFNPGSAPNLGLSITDLGAAVISGVRALIAVAGLLFFVMLVVGGIQYVLSGGDKVGATAARDRITHALIGIIIVAAAFAITALVSAVTGFNALNVSINQFYT